VRPAAVAAAVAAAAVAAVAGLALFTEALDDAGPVRAVPQGPDAVARPPPDPIGERAALMTESECAAGGGEWRWVNAFFKSCVLPYPDAGKECTASSECEGGCFARDFDSLEAGVGTCLATTYRSGCMGEVGASTIDCLYDDIMVSCTRDSTDPECEGLR